MNNLPQDLKYAATHEWARKEANQVIVLGITDFAQEQLGDVVFVELPEVGSAVTAGDTVAVVESVKAASDIYSPVTGKIIAVNDSLEDAPQLINEDCYEEGWLFKVAMEDESELDEMMDHEAYQDNCIDQD